MKDTFGHIQFKKETEDERFNAATQLLDEKFLNHGNTNPSTFHETNLQKKSYTLDAAIEPDIAKETLEIFLEKYVDSIEYINITSKTSTFEKQENTDSSIKTSKDKTVDFYSSEENPTLIMCKETTVEQTTHVTPLN